MENSENESWYAIPLTWFLILMGLSWILLGNSIFKLIGFITFIASILTLILIIKNKRRIENANRSREITT